MTERDRFPIGQVAQAFDATPAGADFADDFLPPALHR